MRRLRTVPELQAHHRPVEVLLSGRLAHESIGVFKGHVGTGTGGKPAISSISYGRQLSWSIVCPDSQSDEDNRVWQNSVREPWEGIRKTLTGSQAVSACRYAFCHFCEEWEYNSEFGLFRKK